MDTLFDALHASAHIVVGMYLGVEQICRDTGGVLTEPVDDHEARRLVIWALAPVYAELLAFTHDDEPEPVALSVAASHEGWALELCARRGLDVNELGASTIRVVQTVFPQIRQAAGLMAEGKLDDDALLELEHELLSEAA